MSSLFGHVNPLVTQIGQRIDKATDGNLMSEDWALNMEICDMINETDEGPKDALKAIKKKIQLNVGKNYAIVMYALIVLETCVKNCGKRFHVLIANKDFLNDLVKIIGPKNDPPQLVQEKVLSLIQTWADAFRNQPDLKEVEKVYLDLKSKGIIFPMTDLDSMAPIHTPAGMPVQVKPISTEQTHVVMGYPARTSSSQQQSLAHQSSALYPNQFQLNKLRNEIGIVNGNIHVFSEMLTDLTPNNIDSSDLELLQELNRTCRNMQQRVVDLIDSVANEEVTVELLALNDTMNNVFLRYDRFERYRTGQAGQTPVIPPPEPIVIDPPPPSYDQLEEQKEPDVGNLIDFGEDSGPPLRNITRELAKTNISSNATPPPAYKPEQRPESDEFDMFAQSRQSFDQNRQSLGATSVYNNQKVDEFSGGLGRAVNVKSAMMTDKDIMDLQDKESDYDEMEKWLEVNDPTFNSTRNPPNVTSSEFDEFLSERETAVNNVPEISTRNTSVQPAMRWHIEKDEDANAMFAL